MEKFTSEHKYLHYQKCENVKLQNQYIYMQRFVKCHCHVLMCRIKRVNLASSFGRLMKFEESLRV